MRNFLFFSAISYNFLTIPERTSLLDKGMVYMKQKISTKKEGTEIVRGTDA